MTSTAKTISADTLPTAVAKPSAGASSKASTPKPVKPVAAKKAAAKPAASKKPVAAKARTEKPVKIKKPKLVRDSFTIPKAEYLVLEALKQRAVQLAQPAKKSELLRAGIKALAAMSDADLRTAMQAVPAIKTGRPAADKAD